MQTNINHIHIFKTNIRSEQERLLVKECLDGHSEIIQWNIDQQDIDCVLRVVSPSLNGEAIIQMIRHSGFEAAELD